MKSKRYHLVPIYVGHHHLLHNLFYVLVRSLHCAIHLRSVRIRAVMIDFKLSIECSDYNIIEVGSVVGDDAFRDIVPVDEVMLDKPGYNSLGDLGK